MTDILAMNALHLLGYLILMVILIFVISLVVIKIKSLKSAKEHKKKLEPLVNYMKKAFEAGYSSEDVVSYLMLNGWTLLDCNRALKILKKEPV